MSTDIPFLGLIILIIIIIGVYFCTKKPTAENITGIKLAQTLFENDKYKSFTVIDFLKYVAKEYPNVCALKVKNGNDGWKSISYSTYYKNVANFSYSMNYWLGPKTNVAII